MRIISGQYKGRRITAPKKLPVRPTTDLAKESLFNILHNQYYFDEITVLDLFSGTGNISYEFASRGVKNITAVDADYGCVKFIEKTSEEFDMPIIVRKSDVFKYIERTIEQHTIIFADPPYKFSLDEFGRMNNAVFKNDLLTEDGVLIIEHSKYTDLSGLDNFDNARHYGGSVFSFFK